MLRNKILKITLVCLVVLMPVIVKNKIVFDRTSLAWSGGALHTDYRLRSAFTADLFETWKSGFFHINQGAAEKMFPKNCYIFSVLNSEKCGGSMFGMESSAEFLRISDLFKYEKSIEEEQFKNQKNEEWKKFLAHQHTYINYFVASFSYILAIPFSESLQFFRYYVGPEVSNIYFDIIKVFAKFIFGPALFVSSIYYLILGKNEGIKLLTILSIVFWIFPTVFIAVPNHRYIYPASIFIYPLSGAIVMYIYFTIKKFILACIKNSFGS